MDKINGLKEIKRQINAVSKSTRDFINSLVDELSFVESDTFYKGEKNDVNSGEGVICGYARIDDSPVFIFAQNFDVLSGGLTSGQADKIIKCLNSAEKLGYPVISILSTHGAKIDEGLSSLEGFAKVISKSSSLYGVVPQICVIKGDVLGSMSYYAANCDFVYMLSDSVLCPTSPLVAAAGSNKNTDKNALFGANTLISK
ncbi:MAG: methylmalonyl-CoA carboxyltransferase, partial [Firmicutes bacterium]|nr:methylmalonyl-CoA carboxyltransferase [Bacillota bacterium]